jgi:HlyD family secretion protein
MKRRTILAAAALTIVVAGLIFGARYLVWNGARPDVLMLSGNIEAHESLLSFQVSGRIADLPVDEGKWLEQDAIVARLDDADYRQQVANDEAALKVARAQLALALAGPRAEEIEADRHAMLNLQAQLEQSRADYNRIQTLYRNSTVSQQERDQAETNYKRADAAYNQARQVYLEARAGTRKEDIDIARAAVDQAAQALEYARLQLAHTILRAPFAGVVLVRQAELGEVVAPGTPVISLGDLDHVWMRAYVPETEIARLRWDQAAVIRTDSFPGKSYHGRVSFISDKAEFTPKSVETHQERVTLVYRIKIDVDNPGHELKPGMPADAEIDLARPGPGASSE